MGSRLDELIARAKSQKGATPSVEKSQVRNRKAQGKPDIHKTKVESRTQETNMFDDLEEYIDNVSNSSLAPDVELDEKDFQVGDPVVGVHKGYKLAGQVIDVNGDNITVEWKNHDVSQVKADDLELSDVDTDYEEQTMYIEAKEPNLGFDKESFNEDADLHDLLTGSNVPDSSGLSFKYGGSCDL